MMPGRPKMMVGCGTGIGSTCTPGCAQPAHIGQGRRHGARQRLERIAQQLLAPPAR